MLFNPNDKAPLLISRDNYEEYFLLYIDNELKDEERKAVEAFVQVHPDLQAELEILITTKLPAETIFLEDKKALLADSMKLNTIDESLLLYIDDELKGKEKRIVAQKIEKDTNYQLQHQLLLKTKLDKNEKIIYPFKEELYRKEQRRPVYWIRAAAAIIVVLGIGALVWTTNSGSGGQVEVAKGPDVVQPNNDVPGQRASTAEQPASQENVARIGVEEKEIKDEQHKVPQRAFIATSKGLKKEKNNNEIEEKRNEVIEAPQVTNKNIAPTDPVQKDEDLVLKAYPSEKVHKQTFNDPPVTTTADDSYNDGTATTAVFNDLAVDNERKTSLKGFLRKATRFIERRTNIKATNENDELLIGAVSIQL